MSSVKTFQAVPDADELARLGRDLRFHPSKTESPKVMTREQVEAFNRDGFVRPFRVYSPEEIADIRAYFDRLLARYVAEGKDSYSISSAHLRHGRVYDILTNPRIVALVKDLLGEDVVGWGTHFFCKMPRDGKAVAWHQDASYWPLSPSKAVTVWLAIDDADRGNACMRVVPGSHWHGHLTYRLSEADESNVLARVAKGLKLEEKLRAAAELLGHDVAIQAEVIGPGIQKNKYGLKEVTIRVFSVLNVFFEAPHRTAAALAALAEAFGGDRAAVVCRELTKTHEEVRRGTLRELARWAENGVRGEVTIVVAGAVAAPSVAGDPESLRAAVSDEEDEGASRKEAIRSVAAQAGVPKRTVYDAVHGVGGPR